MTRILPLVLALLAAGVAQARQLGLGLDAFNRSVPQRAAGPSAFSPLSFEIDCVSFAEAVDPIQRSKFASALHVMDEFPTEYGPIARMPFEFPRTNGLDIVWAHAFVMVKPWRIQPSFRTSIQEFYGFEICEALFPYGVESWVRARFEGDFDDWRMPPQPQTDVYTLQDIVSVTARSETTNGWKRLCPTHTVYRVPLAGGSDFYALVPKEGRPVSSVRARLTSVALPEILAMTSAVIDPPKPVRLSLPPVDFVATNELTGAFSYFKFPTTALKPFPVALRPSSLRQTVRFRLKPAEPSGAPAEHLEGPFLFFIHDPVVNTLPVVGIVPERI